MISVQDPKEFVPHGRGHCRRHPREVGLPPPSSDAAAAIAAASGRQQAGRWRLYLYPEGGEDEVEEELYTEDNVLVCSRGPGAHRAFTLDAPVSNALRCEYTSSAAAHVLSEHPPQATDASQRIAALSCVSAAAVHTWTDDGEHFITPLPFQVRRLWSMYEGVLIERHVTEDDKMPTLFSLLHPLDDIAPLITRIGACEPSLATGGQVSVVLVCRRPPLCVTYDQQTGTHTVWRVRRTEPTEWWAPDAGELTMAATPHSLSRCSQPAGSVGPSPAPAVRSESNTPLPRSRNNSRMNASAALHSLSAGPGPHSRSQSPSVLAMSANTASYLRLHVTPSPQRPGASTAAGSLLDETILEQGEPLRPEICLQHIWRDSLTTSEPARSGFLTTDLSGVSYVVLILSSRGQLRLIRLDSTADGGHTVRGQGTTLQGRDAVSIPATNTMLVVDQSSSLVLYSGLFRLCKVHIPGIPPPALSLSLTLPPSLPGSPFCPPRRSSLVPSSRPAGSGLEARFDDALSLTLSPVRPEPEQPDPSPYKFDSTGQEDVTMPLSGSVAALRDVCGDSVIMEHASGSLYRFSIPCPADSGVVAACLRAGRGSLPRELANQLTARWYMARHAPGARHMTPEKRWRAFAGTLLRMLGYQVERLPIATLLDVAGPSVTHQRGKRSRSEDGTDEDWEFLVSSAYHAEFMSESRPAAPGPAPSDVRLDPSAPLFPHMATLLFVLHLVYEDCKLDSLSADLLPAMAGVLQQLALDLGWSSYSDHYWRDFPGQCRQPGEPHTSCITPQDLPSVQPASYVSPHPPDLLRSLEGGPAVGGGGYPHLAGVNELSAHMVMVYALLRGQRAELSVLLRPVPPPPTAGAEPSGLLNTVTELLADQQARDAQHQQQQGQQQEQKQQLAVRLLDKLGYVWSRLQLLPAGVRLPLVCAVLAVRAAPPADCPDSLCRLVGREELTGAAPPPSAAPPPAPLPASQQTADSQPAAADMADDGAEAVDTELVKLRWPADHRLEEAHQMLQSCRPVSVAAPPRPELSDHERLDEQKRLLYALCQRTMALPAGRGMVGLHAAAPVVTQPLAVPTLCLTGRAPPRGATVDLNDMDLPPNTNTWPHFHNGVAAGLRVAPNAAQIDAAWILYNRPKTSAENPVEHAGFLMALGLNGHLAHLARLNVHDYLIKGNEMTSVGILLGLAACKRGTMDISTTKLLSIHVESMLPPTSRELDIAHSVQVAAVLGVGLVYQGSSNRHMAEVLLREMSRPPGPEMENSCDREAYALSAGLGLGLVTLGSGSDQLGITASLHQLIFGGNKPPLTGPQKEKYKTPSYHIREGDTVNTDVTAAGATLALGLMYMGSGNKAVADWLAVPDTLYLLDMVRPDLLQLRTLSRALVLWDQVRPSRHWVDSHLPPLVRPDTDRPPLPGMDYQTISQVYCHVTSGACLALGLRYAGTADPEAYETLLHYTRTFIGHTSSSVADEAGRPTVENCLCVTLTALAMVMAGTGDLDVMRICRYLRSRVGPQHATVNYGSHLAVHMSLGLLFLGGGRHTLSNSRPAVAALICGFFPRYPLTSCDGRYHLQAFRHLYVLAAEPRLLVPRDLGSGQLTYCHLAMTLRTPDSPAGRQVAVEAPCLLPQLDTIVEIRVDDDRFWPFTVTSGAGVKLLAERLRSGGRLNVKRKAMGGLHQQELRAQLTQTLVGERQANWSAQAELLLSSVSPEEQRSLCRHLLPPCSDAGDRLPLQLAALLQLCLTGQQSELFLPAVSLLLEARAGRHLRPLRLLRLAGAGSTLGRIADCAELWIQTTLAEREHEASAALTGYLTGRSATSDPLQLSAYLSFFSAPRWGCLSQLPEESLQDVEAVFDLLPSDHMSSMERVTVAQLLAGSAAQA